MSFTRLGVAPEKAAFRPALPLCSMPGLYGADMTKMTYSEQLKHPNWQRKRLEALNAAEFRCQCCYDAETTLHVHHKRYFKGRMAWEYALAELAVLCESCHEEEHAKDDVRQRLFSRLDVDGPLSADDLVAYGAGAMNESIGDDHELLALLEQIKEAKPAQFWSGRVARDLDAVFLWIEGLQQVSHLLLHSREFCDEVASLLKKHGVELQQWDF